MFDVKFFKFFKSVVYINIYKIPREANGQKRVRSLCLSPCASLLDQRAIFGNTSAQSLFWDDEQTSSPALAVVNSWRIKRIFCRCVTF